MFTNRVSKVIFNIQILFLVKIIIICYGRDYHYHDVYEEEEIDEQKENNNKHHSIGQNLVLPMRLAVNAASQLEVNVFTERPLLLAVDFHVFLASSAMDSIVLPGQLIKIPVEQHGPMRRLFLPTVSSCMKSVTKKNEPIVFQGIAVIDGDLIVPDHYGRNQFLCDVVA
jgi:hypothetical protein